MYVVMTCIIPIYIRTERVNVEIVFSIPPREKAYLHANLVAIATSLTSSCIVMYVPRYVHVHIIMYCRKYVSFTSGKRVNERIILRYTFQKEDQFPCKTQLFTRSTCGYPAL